MLKDGTCVSCGLKRDEHSPRKRGKNEEKEKKREEKEEEKKQKKQKKKKKKKGWFHWGKSSDEEEEEAWEKEKEKKREPVPVVEPKASKPSCRNAWCYDAVSNNGFCSSCWENAQYSEEFGTPCARCREKRHPSMLKNGECSACYQTGSFVVKGKHDQNRSVKRTPSRLQALMLIGKLDVCTVLE
jgi:hypothetical protein